jgi:acyl-coenzyme A thioesterase PaaI-like protein
VRIPIDDRHLRPGGTVSGPTLMWLADCGTYLMILAQVGPVALTVTTDFSMNLLHRGEPGRDLIGIGRILKLGKRLAVTGFTILSDGTDEPNAHATLTYSIPLRA